VDALMLKQQATGEMDAEERHAVLAALDLLKDYFTAEPESHSATPTEKPGSSDEDAAHLREAIGRDLSMLRRRLDLLEAEF